MGQELLAEDHLIGPGPEHDRSWGLGRRRDLTSPGGELNTSVDGRDGDGHHPAGGGREGLCEIRGYRVPEAPTAQPSVPGTAAIARKALALVIWLGLGTTVQANPSQCSVGARLTRPTITVHAPAHSVGAAVPTAVLQVARDRRRQI
jgi:hypothetical protein